MNSSVKERIKLFLKHKGIGQNKFADIIGVSSGYVNNIRKSIQPDKLDRIAKHFPELNTGWLMTGEGEMLKKNSVVEAIPTLIENNGEFFTENNNGVKFYKLENGKYRITVKKVPFCAYGRFANEADTLEPNKEDWEEESFEFGEIVHGKYLAFEVKGDSMDDGTRNSFEEGDVLLVRELGKQHWRDKFRFNDHPYWVIVFDSSILIKQMVAQNLETGDLTFHSLNPSPEYTDFILNVDRIRALYYVLQKKPKTVKF